MRSKRNPAGRRPLPLIGSFIERAVALGAKRAVVVRTRDIFTAPWVRMKCRYGCGCWGSSLCCPPNTPTPAETREVLDSYGRAVLFEAGRGEPKELAVKLEREVFLAGYYKAFGLGAGPCRLCPSGCAADEGCRHPEKARPAMEACGIDVYATVRAAGFEIEVVRSRDDEQHYFGAVLVD
jgi:predicted metal-binding protein